MKSKEKRQCAGHMICVSGRAQPVIVVSVEVT